MNTTYHRDLNANYLAVSAENEPGWEEYCFEMMKKNRIPGLIPMEKRMLNGRTEVWFKVTGLIPVSDVYSSVRLQYGDVLLIVGGLEQAVRTAGEYLMDADRFLLLPEYLFLDNERKNLFVCTLPDGQSRGKQLTLLAEWMLRRLDHKDRRAVAAAYQFYQKAAEPNCSMRDVFHGILEKMALFEQEISVAASLNRDKLPEAPCTETDIPISGKGRKTGTIPVWALIPAAGILTGDVCAMLSGLLSPVQAGGIFFAVTGTIFLLKTKAVQKRGRRETND